MFKEGEKIQLNSGGAVMTVFGVSDDGLIECRWHNINDEPKTEFYRSSMLQSVPPTIKKPASKKRKKT